MREAQAADRLTANKTAYSRRTKAQRRSGVHRRTRSPFHVLRQSLPTESVADMRRTTARGATQCTQTYTVAPETGSKTQRCGAISRQKAYG